MKRFFYPREWFFILMQLVSAVAFLWAIFYADTYQWITSLVGYFLITCLGITVCFHRLLTHRSYKLWKPLEYLFSYFGNLGCTGSSVGWVFVHRTHHCYADKVGDPHSPVVLGPMGAVIGDYSGKFNKWAVRDVINDPVHRVMHEYYIPLVLGTCLTLAIIDITLVVYLFLIPIFFNTVASRFSNWIDHDAKFGNQCSGSKDQSRNVWWWALLTFGEGWHNNHHNYPGDWQIGKSWWQFDPGKYVIKILMFLGLASNNNLSYNKLRS